MNQEYKEFRRLLRKGIGSRKQCDFSAKTGISREHLNRMLNNEKIPRPRENTLEVLSCNMSNVSLNELRAACGYTELTLEEQATAYEENVKETLKKIFSIRKTWDSTDAFAAQLQSSLYKGSVNTPDNEEECSGDLAGISEKRLLLSLKWWDSKTIFRTEFYIYFSALETDGIVILETSFTVAAVEPPKQNTLKHYPQLTRYTYCTDRAEERAAIRLLESIFGSGVHMTTTTLGYGLEFTTVPEGFKGFVLAHASSFCTSKKNVELFQTLLNSDEDPESIFENYHSKDGASIGAGAVVADIMNKEYRGVEEEFGDVFIFYEPDEDVGENAKGYVMIADPRNDERKIPTKLLKYLYCCARELKSPTFGMCYYQQSIICDETQVYSTEDFYLTEREK